MSGAATPLDQLMQQMRQFQQQLNEGYQSTHDQIKNLEAQKKQY